MYVVPFPYNFMLKVLFYFSHAFILCISFHLIEILFGAFRILRIVREILLYVLYLKRIFGFTFIPG